MCPIARYHPATMIGESHQRLGGDRFVSWRARFVDDVSAPGMLHAVVLRSPHAHARLVSIDAKAAREIPGVVAVLTAAWWMVGLVVFLVLRSGHSCRRHTAWQRPPHVRRV